MKGQIKAVNRKRLCNFALEVVSVDDVHINGSEKCSQYIQVCLNFGENGIKGQKKYYISINEIDKVHWKELDIRCRYNPEIPESKVERYITDRVRAQIEKAPKRTVVYLERAGMHKIDGQPIFYTGRAVIQSPVKKTDHVIKMASLEENLDVNDELMEFDAVNEIFGFIDLSPEAGQVLLAYKLGCFMRMAYENVGKAAKGCIFYMGKQAYRKRRIPASWCKHTTAAKALRVRNV